MRLSDIPLHWLMKQAAPTLSRAAGDVPTPQIGYGRHSPVPRPQIGHGQPASADALPPLAPPGKWMASETVDSGWSVEPPGTYRSKRPPGPISPPSSSFRNNRRVSR